MLVVCSKLLFIVSHYFLNIFDYLNCITIRATPKTQKRHSRRRLFFNFPFLPLPSSSSFASFYFFIYYYYHFFYLFSFSILFIYMLSFFQPHPPQKIYDTKHRTYKQTNKVNCKSTKKKTKTNNIRKNITM